MGQQTSQKVSYVATRKYVVEWTHCKIRLSCDSTIVMCTHADYWDMLLNREVRVTDELVLKYGYSHSIIMTQSSQTLRSNNCTNVSVIHEATLANAVCPQTVKIQQSNMPQLQLWKERPHKQLTVLEVLPNDLLELYHFSWNTPNIPAPNHGVYRSTMSGNIVKVMGSESKLSHKRV